MSVQFFIVDRISAREAVLVDDQGRAVTLPLSHFRHGIAEHMMLRVPADGDTPDWAAATVDQAETQRRARHSQSMLEKLQEREADS